MKKILFFMIISMLLLVACNGESSTNKEKNNDLVKSENIDTSEDDKKEDSNEDEVNDENEVKEGPLTEIGQWTKDVDGTIVTLKNIVFLEKTLDLNPIKLELHEIKLLERAKGDELLNTIQVTYTTENLSDKNITFNGITVITTNTKHQIDVLLENLGYYPDAGIGEYYGNIKREGIIIVPYLEESFEELESISLITDDIWDSSEHDILYESTTEVVTFD